MTITVQPPREQTAMMRSCLCATNGHPFAYNYGFTIVERHRPSRLPDGWPMAKLAHSIRKRITPRTVCAKGSGARSPQTMASDSTPYSKSKFFAQMGQLTPTLYTFPPSPANKSPPTPNGTWAGWIRRFSAIVPVISRG
ncbi:MAG: catalase [Magnetococcales bacterium]|nr:catalase [Magnetococcales bacterium]